MAIQYGLTLENESIIFTKAKDKKDGVYSFRGVDYRVVEGIVTHYATGTNILERVCGFNCIVETFPYNKSFGKEKLKRIK